MRVIQPKTSFHLIETSAHCKSDCIGIKEYISTYVGVSGKKYTYVIGQTGLGPQSFTVTEAIVQNSKRFCTIVILDGVVG